MSSGINVTMLFVFSHQGGTVGSAVTAVWLHYITLAICVNKQRATKRQ